MLKSAVDMDFRQLEHYLAYEFWNNADEETARIMLAIASRIKKDYFKGNFLGIEKTFPYLEKEDFKYFPCQDLHIIDQLWLKHSNGRFGFSVQKRIYENLGGTSNWNHKIWRTFCETVGWKEKGTGTQGWTPYMRMNFKINAPEGHLPAVIEPVAPNWVLGDDLTARLCANTRVAFFYHFDV